MRGNFRILEKSDDKYNWFHVEKKHWFWGWQCFYVEGWVQHNYISLKRCEEDFNAYRKWYKEGSPSPNTYTIHEI